MCLMPHLAFCIQLYVVSGLIFAAGTVLTALVNAPQLTRVNIGDAHRIGYVQVLDTDGGVIRSNCEARVVAFSTVSERENIW